MMKKRTLSAIMALGIVACGVATLAVEPGGIVRPVDVKSGQTVKLDLDIPPGQAPSADACPDVNQGMLSSAGGTIAADTTGMADDWDDNGCAWCSYGSGAPDQVIEFTVPVDGNWEFTTCGPSNGGVAPFDASIQVRLANPGCSDSFCVGCDSRRCDATPGWGATFGGCLSAGSTYYLIVDGGDAASFGAVTVDYANLGPCADPCPDLVDEGQLAAAGGTIDGDTTGASGDHNNDGADCDVYGWGGKDVIHRFTVEASGSWEFDSGCLGGSASFDTSLMLREDYPLGCPGTWLACNGDACPSYASTVSATLLAGKVYYLVVDGFSFGVVGTYEVTYTHSSCISDADCVDADLCNGNAVCNMAAGACEPGAPVVCAGFEDCDPATGDCFSAADDCVSWWSGRVRSWYFVPALFGLGNRVADDTQLEPGAGHELISYTLPLIARDITTPIGDPYTVSLELWSTKTDGSCNPDAPIPGTMCSGLVDDIDAGASPADIFVCAPSGGLGTGIMIPRADEVQCGIDAFIVYDTGPTEGGVGFSFTGEEQVIGGSAVDDETGGDGTIWFETDPGAGTFYPFFPADEIGFPLDFGNAQICTQEAIGSCCTIVDFAGACIDNETLNDCEATTGYASWTAFATCPSDCMNPDYCTSGWSTNWVWFENVTLADINNTTAADVDGYGDYTALSTDLKVGVTNQLSVTVNNQWFDSNVKAWIDWNHDYTWDDPFETYDLGTGWNTFTVSIDIMAPGGALLGATTMRVMESDTIEPPPAPCNSGSFGETEDYTVNLVVGICGDGIVDSDEECDNGSDVGTDCCDATCRFEAAIVCRAAVDVCDVDEVCPGATAFCPADAYAATGTLCEADARECYLDKTCDGMGACVENVDVGADCGGPATECSDQDTCDGVGNCSVLNHWPDGTLCGDPATECKDDDTCLGGACQVAPFRTCGPTDGCCPPDCDPRDHDLDCGDPVPTVSTWGVVILAMLLLVAMKVHFGRRRAVGKAMKGR